jgi:hypothetical protein
VCNIGFTELKMVLAMCEKLTSVFGARNLKQKLLKTVFDSSDGSLAC